MVKARVGEMAAKRAFRTPYLAKIMLKEGAPTPIPTEAIPVFNIGLTELAEKGDLSGASQKSWRYLVKQEEKVVASADALICPDKKPVFSHINEGPLVEGTVSAIQVANANEEVKKGQYIARLIMVPALYFAALWLVDSTKKRDLAIPIEPAPAPFVANKVIPLEELKTTLQKLAKSSLASQQQDDTLGG
jgi:hypothetical protein